MRKYISISIWCLTLASMLYTSFWWYQALSINRFIEKGKALFTNTLNVASVHFLYSQAHVSGFPFRFIVALNDPHLMIEQADNTLVFHSPSPLYMDFSPFSNHVILTMPKEMRIASSGHRLPGHLAVEFSSLAPTLALTLASSDIPPFWLANPVTTTPESHLAKLTYEDQGFTLFSREHTPLLAVNSSRLEMRPTDQTASKLATRVLWEMNHLVSDMQPGTTRRTVLADMLIITPRYASNHQEMMIQFLEHPQNQMMRKKYPVADILNILTRPEKTMRTDKVY